MRKDFCNDSEDFGKIMSRLYDLTAASLLISQLLATSYNKEIFFRNSLLVKAGIITGDKRLLERLLGLL